MKEEGFNKTNNTGVHRDLRFEMRFLNTNDICFVFVKLIEEFGSFFRLFRMDLRVLVLLLMIPPSFSQQDLEGKVFVFPYETNTAHVLLRPTITRPLQKVSVCLHSYSDLSRPYTVFSLTLICLYNEFCLFSSLDLEDKVFVFPKETNTAHVILRPTITRPLQKVSVCLQSYTDLSRPYTPFSLATPGKDNAFLIYLQPPNTCSVYINQEVTSFKTDSESLDWRHICVTWDSDTGVVQLWVNGKLYPGRVSMKGSSIAAETSIVLGQEQDSFGGGFDASQSLVGEISDVHMWDYVLTQADIQKVLSGDLHGNVINWNSLRCEIKGEVLVKPKIQRKSVLLLYTPSLSFFSSYTFPFMSIFNHFIPLGSI
ncbi:C-reactive protein-like [Lithobates pipiens]